MLFSGIFLKYIRIRSFRCVQSPKLIAYKVGIWVWLPSTSLNSNRQQQHRSRVSFFLQSFIQKSLSSQPKSTTTFLFRITSCFVSFKPSGLLVCVCCVCCSLWTTRYEVLLICVRFNFSQQTYQRKSTTKSASAQVITMKWMRRAHFPFSLSVIYIYVPPHTFTTFSCTNPTSNQAELICSVTPRFSLSHYLGC